MTRYFLIATLFTPMFSFAYPDKLEFFENGKYQSADIVALEGVHVTKNCSSKKSACIALGALKVKAKKTISKVGTVGHPASRYCNDSDGAIRLMTAKDKSQYDFCLFKDGSMIDAWDLYYFHFPRGS